MNIKTRLNTLIHRYLDGAYHVGFVENWDLEHPAQTLKNVKWLDTTGYNGGWFADPFIIAADNNTITLLVEEFIYATGRGRLSRLTVKRDGYKLLKVEPILDINTHLSYPHPIYKDSQTYICPENCAAYQVAIYKYDGNQLHSPVKILDGHYVDTQIINHEGSWYAFTTIIEQNGGSSTLEIFSAPDLTGPYTHTQTIHNAVNEQRGAGPIFKYKDMLIRPTQNCGGGYGQGVVFQQLKLTDGIIQQKEYTRIDTNPRFKYGLCFHTFSPMGDIAAVDGFDYPCRAIGKLAPKLYNLKRLILKLLKR